MVRVFISITIIQQSRGITVAGVPLSKMHTLNGRGVLQRYERFFQTMTTQKLKGIAEATFLFASVIQLQSGVAARKNGSHLD